MRWFRTAIVGLTLSLVAADGPDGTADEGGSDPEPMWTDGKTQEIVVWGDPFARWDDTRWLIKTEVVTPYPILFMREKNSSVNVSGFQVELVMTCSKAWKLDRKHYEIGCRIEEVALQASLAGVASERRIETGNLILADLDRMLTGAALQLQVADDGRVTSLDLEGLEKDTDRQQHIHETMRQVMSRISVGFDMKMQKFNQLHEGKWIEYRSRLMSMPLPANATASQSNSTVIHYLSNYKGQVMVQSIGEGLIGVPPMASDAESAGKVSANAAGAAASGVRGSEGILGTGGGAGDAGGLAGAYGESERTYEAPSTFYDTSLIGVSIYDADEGFMTERVFAVEGIPTSSALFNVGKYWHAGRIQILGETDEPGLRMTSIISPRGHPEPGLPRWVPIEAISR